MTYQPTVIPFPWCGRYLLTASTATVQIRKWFDAADSTDATFAAMATILDLAASDPSGPWAKGAIQLTDESTGTVLHEMPAKD